MNDALKESERRSRRELVVLASREVQVMAPILRKGLELVGHLDDRDLTVEVAGSAGSSCSRCGSAHTAGGCLTTTPTRPRTVLQPPT
jgi:hypothetical protein